MKLEKLVLLSPRGVGMGRSAENLRTRQLYDSLSQIDSLRELMSCPNAPLLTVAAIAAPYFDEIFYIDEETQETDLSVVCDMVGMSFMTQQATRAYELSDFFRSRGIYTVCGGMHPTNLPEEAAKHFDTVFIGEGEKTWPKFLSDCRSGRPERFYRNTELIDLAQSPKPLYGLLDMAKYRTIPVQISRGCPHNCAFCASTKVYGPKYRHKSVEQVLSELETIKSMKERPHVYFTDDNMLVDRKFSQTLLRELAQAGIRWMSHTDISLASKPELLKLLHASGCRKLVIGFESIEPASLREMEKWKYEQLSEYAEAISIIQSYGIGVWGTFILGLDGDDTGVFQRVVDFTLENHLYGAMLSVPTPFPGSELYRRLEADGRILSRHWGSYTLWNVVVEPAKMRVDELERGFGEALRQIYSPQAARDRLLYFKNLNRNRVKNSEEDPACSAGNAGSAR